jgi:hypothetical protein
MAYAVAKFDKMFSRKDSNIQQLYNTLDLFAGTNSFNLADQQLEIVFGLQDLNAGNDFIPIPPEMGKIDFL